MILSDQDIRDAVAAGHIKIEPFEEGQIEPASYDIRVGNQAASSAQGKKIDLQEAGFVQVRPGDFVIVSTFERLELDSQTAARFGLISRYSRQGLIATTGAQIDPGFRGRLFVGLTNLSTKEITLPHRDGFLTIEYHRLANPVKRPYSGPYQDRDELGPDEIKVVMEREYMSQTDMMRTLESLVSSVDSLKQTLNWRVPVVVASIIAIFLALHTVLISLL